MYRNCIVIFKNHVYSEIAPCVNKPENQNIFPSVIEKNSVCVNVFVTLHSLIRSHILHLPAHPHDFRLRQLKTHFIRTMT